MSRVDFVFIALAIFSYFSIMMELKEASDKNSKYEELNRKKQIYAERMFEMKRLETMKKQAAERKLKHKVNFEQLANTVEMLSNISDEEVKRKSRVTSGKF
jgi:Tfp pilus assembly protein PilO